MNNFNHKRSIFKRNTNPFQRPPSTPLVKTTTEKGERFKFFSDALKDPTAQEIREDDDDDDDDDDDYDYVTYDSDDESDYECQEEFEEEFEKEFESGEDSVFTKSKPGNPDEQDLDLNPAEDSKLTEKLSCDPETPEKSRFEDILQAFGSGPISISRHVDIENSVKLINNEEREARNFDNRGLLNIAETPKTKSRSRRPAILFKENSVESSCHGQSKAQNVEVQNRNNENAEHSKIENLFFKNVNSEMNEVLNSKKAKEKCILNPAPEKSESRDYSLSMGDTGNRNLSPGNNQKPVCKPKKRREKGGPENAEEVRNELDIHFSDLDFLGKGENAVQTKRKNNLEDSVVYLKRSKQQCRKAKEKDVREVIEELKTLPICEFSLQRGGRVGAGAHNEDAVKWSIRKPNTESVVEKSSKKEKTVKKIPKRTKCQKEK